MSMKNPMSGVRGGYTPTAAGYGLLNNGMPSGEKIKAGGKFPGTAQTLKGGPYTPAVASNGVTKK